MPTSEDYENYRKKGLKENLKNFNVDEAYVSKKIKEFVQFNPDFTIEEVKDEIKKNSMLTRFFLKDPIRQNMYETVVSEYIKKIEGVIHFGKPSPDLYITTDRKLISKNEIKRQNLEAACKSIDFYWEYEGKKIYAYHKYAKEPGGHQDNQYEDLLKFIQIANSLNIDNAIFLAIADGDYFNSNDGKVDKKRMDNLRDTANKRNTFGLTSEEIKITLNNL
jgi:hypothetical protein